MKKLSEYFYDSLIESMGTISVKDVMEYYGESENCNILDYFKHQIRDEKLYDSVTEFNDKTFLGFTDDLWRDFEEARERALFDWLSEKVNSVNDDLEDVSDKVEITPIYDTVEGEDGEFTDFLLYNEITLNGKHADIFDSESSTVGGWLFERIYDIMDSQDIRKAAKLAGGKYVYVEYDKNEDYTLHIWE